MEPKNADINLLLACLLIFSLTIGAVYTVAAVYTVRSQETVDMNKTERPYHPVEQLLPLARPFIISGSVEKIIEFIKSFPPKTSHDIAQRIVEEKESSLNKRDKEQLIFGLAQAFAEKPAIQKKLFDLFFELDEKVSPIQLVHAAKNGYGPVLPAFITWANIRQKEHPELKDIAQNSLFTAIDEDELKALKTLIEHGIPVDKKQASRLLWHTVSNNKSAGFVPFLAEHGADLWSTKAGHTLVTKATELNNRGFIEALIITLKKQGVPQKRIEAYINRFVDKTVGTALQIALQKGHTNLEIYLREKGASE